MGTRAEKPAAGQPEPVRTTGAAWGGTAGSRRGRRGREVLAVAAVTAGVHVALFGFIVLASKRGGNLATGADFWTNALVHWDAHHYLAIAEGGYQDRQLLAFFPLFPALVRVVSELGIGLLPAALLVNFVAHTGGAVVLFRLLRLDLSSSAAWGALILFLLYPATLMFVVPYSESVAFLLVVGTIYTFRRGRRGWSAILGLLAGLSRATGWLVATLLVIEVLSSPRMHRRWPAWVATAAPLLGLGGYMALNAWAAGDPLAFLGVQEQTFHRSLAWPTVALARTWAALDGPWPTWVTYGAANLAGVALAWSAAAGTAWRGRRSYAGYCVLGALFVTFQSRWLSVLRYDVMLFPLFPLLAGTPGSRLRRRVMGILFGTALLFFASEYANGRWAM